MLVLQTWSITGSGSLLSLQTYKPISIVGHMWRSTNRNEKVDGIFNYDLGDLTCRLIQNKGKMILSHTSYYKNDNGTGIKEPLQGSCALGRKPGDY